MPNPAKLLAIFVILAALLGGLHFYNTKPKVSLLNADKKVSTDSEHKHYQATAFTPDRLENLVKKDPDKYVIIDVRSKTEYDEGHLPGAIHADYYDTQALKKAAGEKIPITYCAFSAMRGPYAAYQLNLAGYENVSVLEGGIMAWAEDIQTLDGADPKSKTVFGHPSNIFPNRPLGEYPKDQGEVEFKITAKQFEFNPRTITVKHGQKVTLHLLSLDVVHGFSLPEFGIEEELLPNKTLTVSFIADRKGSFPFVCSVICGEVHNHASMVGNLIIK